MRELMNHFAFVKRQASGGWLGFKQVAIVRHVKLVRQNEIPIAFNVLS
jgi:hypothetical protein